MDAIKHVITNVPDWVQRLDVLNTQIQERQMALAAVSESSTAGGSGSHATVAKSIRNRGSTETLKPPDEPEAHPQESSGVTSNPLDTSSPLEGVASAPDVTSPTSPGGSNSLSPSALARQTNQVKAAAQARARAALRKRQRTESVLSAEGAMPKYRTRSMIIVYYDQMVQTFFEDLVKFVSASRNMMRKAKMYAKVAKIKRLTDISQLDDNDDILPPSSTEAPIEAAPPPAKGEEDDLPVLRYVSTRRMLPVSRPIYAKATWTASVGRPDPEPADVYAELDKGLEYVQSMCEHAAHQFLRDGDCTEEVANIQKRLRHTKDLADKELERVQQEDPDPEGPLAAREDAKSREFRPYCMRREHIGGFSARDVTNDLEVDEALDGTGEDFDLPKLQYRSTRLMR